MSKNIRTYSTNEKLVEERRSQIIRCAVKLFNKKGFDGTSMRDIAHACKMTSANIYNYIEGKDDIIRLIMEGGHVRSYQFIREANEGLERLGVIEALKNAISLFFRHIDGARAGVTFLYRGIASFRDDIRAQVLKVEADETAVFENILHKGCASGEFEVNGARLLADNIISLGQMWAVKHGMLGGRYTIDEYTRVQTNSILRQIQLNGKPDYYLK